MMKRCVHSYDLSEQQADCDKSVFCVLIGHGLPPSSPTSGVNERVAFFAAAHGLRFSLLTRAFVLSFVTPAVQRRIREIYALNLLPRDLKYIKESVIWTISIHVLPSLNFVLANPSYSALYGLRRFGLPAAAAVEAAAARALVLAAGLALVG